MLCLTTQESSCQQASQITGTICAIPLSDQCGPIGAHNHFKSLNEVFAIFVPSIEATMTSTLQIPVLMAVG